MNGLKKRKTILEVANQLQEMHIVCVVFYIPSEQNGPVGYWHIYLVCVQRYMQMHQVGIKVIILVFFRVYVVSFRCVENESNDKLLWCVFPTYSFEI